MTTDALQRLTNLASRSLGFADARLSLVDAVRRRLVAGASVGGRSSQRSLARLDDLVLQTGEHVIVNEGRDGADRSPAGPTSYLGVPVLDGDANTIGVLAVSDSDVRVTDDNDLQLLIDFAAVIADQLDQLRRLGVHDDHGADSVEVARALAAGEITPWYQPIIDFETGRVRSLEALARWQLPNGELANTATFIETAERTDLIVELDLVIARQAMTDLKRWQADHPEVQVNINFSGRHLDREDWVTDVVTMARDTGVAPETLNLELTETARPADSQVGRSMMDELRQQGFRIWFDDFGSGWFGAAEPRPDAGGRDQDRQLLRCRSRRPPRRRRHPGDDAGRG